jgi:hypothetical protein
VAVELKIPTDKILPHIQEEIAFLELSHPTVEVVVAAGIVMQPAQVDRVVVDVLDRVVADQTITQDQMIVVIQIWVVAVFLGKDSQADQALDLIVKVKTVTKPAAAAVQVLLDLVLKMTAMKDEWVKVAPELPVIF